MQHEISTYQQCAAVLVKLQTRTASNYTYYMCQLMANAITMQWHEQHKGCCKCTGSYGCCEHVPDGACSGMLCAASKEDRVA